MVSPKELEREGAQSAPRHREQLRPVCSLGRSGCTHQRRLLPDCIVLVATHCCRGRLPAPPIAGQRSAAGAVPSEAPRLERLPGGALTGPDSVPAVGQEPSPAGGSKGVTLPSRGAKNCLSAGLCVSAGNRLRCLVVARATRTR